MRRSRSGATAAAAVTDPLVGTRWVCVEAGSTLLVDGAEYAVIDVFVDGPVTLVEMDRCRGFLFGLRRFRRIDTFPVTKVA